MNTRAFTLIEILAATVVSTIVLLAIYGTFQRAVHTRDSAQERTRQSRLRERAAAILRNDLRAAYLSGGLFACTMEGGPQSQKSRFPGYLRFTATSGVNHTGETWGDVQQIEYYLIEDATPSDGVSTGILVRALTRDLLTVPAPPPAAQQPLT
ncbi:MAG: prepilin-type N-terminal cleavage/methylation domain-containing protein, partial [Chthoniobacteraceae bacterium]|nr:prepilin-type N-terminal cleavage/methylation domain-containing protein [Chthoniobacteraceae bacterium]